MRWYHWLAIPFVIGAAALAYALGRRRGDLANTLAADVGVIEARAVAKRMKAQLGAENARQWVEERYADEIKRLDQKQLDQARQLRADPAALAEFLVRAAYDK